MGGGTLSVERLTRVASLSVTKVIETLLVENVENVQDPPKRLVLAEKPSPGARVPDGSVSQVVLALCHSAAISWTAECPSRCVLLVALPAVWMAVWPLAWFLLRSWGCQLWAPGDPVQSGQEGLSPAPSPTPQRLGLSEGSHLVLGKGQPLSSPGSSPRTKGTTPVLPSSSFLECSMPWPLPIPCL